MVQERKKLFIIFGGSGDLAQRKLYPALFQLFQHGYLKDHFAVIGTSRRSWPDEYYRGIIHDSLAAADVNVSADEEKSFASHFYYQSNDVTDAAHYVVLRKLAAKLDAQYGTDGNRIYYMAMAPRFFGTIANQIKSEHLLTDNGYNRLIIEKPFGRDYDSAKKLNDDISAAFNENQIYRIDHYLGKEMIQSLFALRFTNPILSAVWNKEYIDNIQITLAEDVGVGDRAGYYETAGSLRDMVQNHIMQIMSLVGMEPPVDFSAPSVTNAKERFFDSLRMYDHDQAMTNFVRGQYGAGKVAGQELKAYRDEENVSPTSNIETYVAGKIMIDNERWCGVPFYIRTGKRLTHKSTQINIVFKKSPIDIFQQPTTNNQFLEPNVLTINVEPNEGYTLQLNGKEVGQSFQTVDNTLDFAHSKKTIQDSPQAYERLILGALDGNMTSFTHWGELAQTWKFVDVIRQGWDAEQPAFPNYTPGTMGPDAAQELLQRDNRQWFYAPNVDGAETAD
ncbi:glucose-6-phosphate 1-dehydrogenase [Lactobacillus selangorensis]|uniref:Glucose-6-phosphate 1-dehydrogenase n=1 Tax=Lactobacillus selangorensis TaxID=81857 RepID=A0A0R2FFX2_9LACO|nr:glucose-6-phosphate dehydrogenase [Lactobacillus selangorensis]KRN27448.1 glucose-6-phosphate 1-dehydrogenase [Lactobacillus selangorensis]KRN31355.1 glucose-6-phosphate 1-dehydrogenase [Lactobacillus selangorensis]